ncbi:hypothetical protein Pryu01_01459 [Paraliobacillus ryukyuensis]|uniref:Lysozyme-like protein n=2 Tax=Paraliobacillus ryukyuensis TaxID=200904 RepID=A0A366EBU8_9BACI|nr:lysozyme-like protein [Paraliobacillus ryukyuensis]
MKRLMKASILLIGAIITIGMVLFFVVIFANEVGREEVNPYPLTEDVISYQPIVEKELAKEAKEEYTAVVLALMMQESAGRGDDPMQASESACGEVGCIDNPNQSIKHGVSYFLDTLEAANGDLELALQSYNFGLGFIDYAVEKEMGYSQDLAIKFSQKKYDELKNTGNYSCLRDEAEEYDACYGDIYYVDAVYKYLPSALEQTDESVQVAQVSESNK